MDILDDMGVSKLSAKVFLKVNYSFNCKIEINSEIEELMMSSNAKDSFW